MAGCLGNVCRRVVADESVILFVDCHWNEDGFWYYLLLFASQQRMNTFSAMNIYDNSFSRDAVNIIRYHSGLHTNQQWKVCFTHGQAPLGMHTSASLDAPAFLLLVTWEKKIFFTMMRVVCGWAPPMMHLGTTWEASTRLPNTLRHLRIFHGKKFTGGQTGITCNKCFFCTQSAWNFPTYLHKLAVVVAAGGYVGA